MRGEHFSLTLLARYRTKFRGFLGEAYFSIISKMRDASRATQEHKTPESNKSVDNLLLHLRRLTSIGILQQEGATRTTLLAAAVALLALTGLPMADNIRALTVGAVQDLDDHCASPSCGCLDSSHLGIDRSTSTPLRHLPAAKIARSTGRRLTFRPTFSQ